MKWFEEHIGRVLGRGRGELVASCADIAWVADQVLDDETTARFVREYFPTQKALSGFLGVSDSTVTAWVKNTLFPTYAKRAILAAYFAGKYLRQVDTVRRETTRPKVVRDADRYMVVQFSGTDKHGTAVGRVLERNIPTEKDALASAAARLALDLLDEHGERLRSEVENVSVPADRKHLEDLVDAFESDRERIEHHFKLEDEQFGFERPTSNHNVYHVGSAAEGDRPEKEGTQ